MKTVRNRGTAEIYQAEPILIKRTRHSHRPNVMFSLGTAPSERVWITNPHQRDSTLEI